MGSASHWISGVHAVTAVVAAGRRKVKTLYYAEKVAPELAAQAQAAGAGLRHTPINELKRLCPDGVYQGVLIEASEYPYVDSNMLRSDALRSNALRGDASPAQQPTFLLALDQVQDPHNCGALLRTAYGCGVEGVLMSKDQSVAITPTVVRTSAGASEFLHICRLAGLPHYLAQLKKRGLWIIGADAGGIAINECRILSEPSVLVLGGEGTGLRETTKKACDQLIKIPMRTNAVIDSFNVSVAGAILMWEMARARAPSR